MKGLFLFFAARFTIQAALATAMATPKLFAPAPFEKE